uniref:Uncharacterized protein n=1 Tax=Pithovirus LCPAC406 TaxID=2506599 RepID=A0A481ZEK1_9VIRU|nr:MAG: uncharacterized protein LCPAC406_01390 [Pithovirus LCPAC406]
MEQRKMYGPIVLFKYLPVTTATFLIPINGEIISYNNIFSLFDITYMSLPTNVKVRTRDKRRFNIPFCPVPGSILSVRYQGKTRGIITSLSSGYFRNSITMDISTREKNVNIKLSSGNIQLCGARSLDTAIEAVNHVLNHANKIQSNLNYMKSNPDLVKKAIEWMKKKTVGKNVIREDIISKKINLICITDDNEIILPWFDIEEVKEGRIIDLFYSLATEFDYHSLLMNAIRNYYTKISLVCNKLSIKYNDIRREMTNYNYDTGFTINRRVLFEAINILYDKGKIGFISQFWNTVHSYVTVFLPIESDIGRPRGKKRKSTIIIYRSGRVTCSARNPNEGERFYTMFSHMIMRLEPWIRVAEVREYVIKTKYFVKD